MEHSKSFHTALLLAMNESKKDLFWLTQLEILILAVISALALRVQGESTAMVSIVYVWPYRCSLLKYILKIHIRDGNNIVW